MPSFSLSSLPPRLAWSRGHDCLGCESSAPFCGLVWHLCKKKKKKREAPSELSELMTLSRLIAVIILRLIYTPSNLFASGFTQTSVPVIVIQIIEMHFNLINAAYPNLLVFVDNTSTKSIHAAPRSRSLFTLPQSLTTTLSAQKSDRSLDGRSDLGSF